MPRTDSLFLDPLQLIEFTRFYAGEVDGGAYPYIDYDPDERWHQRIYRDRRVDIWLISWLPTQGTQLHDHGGSSGSFTVLSGQLTEAVVSGGSALVDHARAAGDSVGFGAHYVHDVRNLSDAPAVSVHAYSPPLTSMTFFDWNPGAPGGPLETITSLATDDPEPEIVPGGVQQAS
jgi:quercetin dioxygenase-like cupin family protein